MKIVTLVNNSMAFDLRVRRQATALAEAGHQVVSIGVLTDRDERRPELPVVDRLRWSWVERRRRKGLQGLFGWLRSVVPVRISRLLWSLGVRLEGVAVRYVTTTYAPLLRAARSEQGDLYIGNDLDTVAVARRAAEERGVPFAYDAHELYTEEEEGLSGAARSARQVVEAACIRRAALRWTVSQPIADVLEEAYGARPVAVVRNVPALPAGFGERGTSGGDDRTSGRSDSRPLEIFYFAANLKLEARGTRELIDAVATCGGGVRVTLRGNAPPFEDRRLRNYLSRHVPAGMWDLLPAVPNEKLLGDSARFDVGAVLNGARNRNELLGLPNKLFEYLACGLAIVAFDTVAVRDLVSRENVGLVVPPNEATGLAEAFRKLRDDRRLLDEFRSNSRLAAGRHNWAVERGRLVALVNSLRHEQARLSARADGPSATVESNPVDGSGEDTGRIPLESLRRPK